MDTATAYGRRWGKKVPRIASAARSQKRGAISVFNDRQYKRLASPNDVVDDDGDRHTNDPDDQDADNPDNLTSFPTRSPTKHPSLPPTLSPVASPSASPSGSPTNTPTKHPSLPPTLQPVASPSASPTNTPTITPTKAPQPTAAPTSEVTSQPSEAPLKSPTKAPTPSQPTKAPSKSPTKDPTQAPTKSLSPTRTLQPTKAPSKSPTMDPTKAPVTSSPTCKVATVTGEFGDVEAIQPVVLTYLYEMDTDISSSASVDQEIIPDLELLMVNFLIPTLFGDDCPTDGGRRLQMISRQSHERKLESTDFPPSSIKGLSSFPEDQLLPKSKCLAGICKLVYYLSILLFGCSNYTLSLRHPKTVQRLEIWILRVPCRGKNVNLCRRITGRN